MLGVLYAASVRAWLRRNSTATRARAASMGVERMTRAGTRESDPMTGEDVQATATASCSPMAGGRAERISRSAPEVERLMVEAESKGLAPRRWSLQGRVTSVRSATRRSFTARAGPVPGLDAAAGRSKVLSAESGRGR